MSDDYCHRCRHSHDGSCTEAREQRRRGYLEQMRATLRAAEKCAHGIAPVNCVECRTAAAARPPEPEEAAHG